MTTTVLKNRNKPKKVEVIPAEKIVFTDTMTKVPVMESDEVGICDITNSNFSEIVLKDISNIQLIEDEIESKIKLRRKKKDLPKFTEHFSISNIDVPVEISTLKVPEQAIPISEVQEEVQKAYDKGFDDGQQVTISTFKAELETHQNWVKTFDDIVKNLHKHYQEELKKLELSVAKLSTLIASELLKKELGENNETIIRIISDTIKSIEPDELIKVRLNPKDIEILEEVKSDLIEQIKTGKGMIVSDYSVDRGGCVMETKVGIIDARIKKQLSKICDTLEDTIKNEYEAEDLTEVFYPEVKSEEQSDD